MELKTIQIVLDDVDKAWLLKDLEFIQIQSRKRSNAYKFKNFFVYGCLRIFYQIEYNIEKVF